MGIIAQQRGITRSLDRLGRLSVPAEMYRALGIQKGDSVEILSGVTAEGYTAVFLRKSTLHCAACNVDLQQTTTISVPLGNITLCGDCVDSLIKAKK